jgi:hypothetical protein
MTSRYQRHASGLIGSPSEPSSRMLDKSCDSGISRPHFMNVRDPDRCCVATHGNGGFDPSRDDDAGPRDHPICLCSLPVRVVKPPLVHCNGVTHIM